MMHVTQGGVAMCGCSGSGDGGLLSANLTVENHGEDHAENHQDGDGEGNSQHHLHVFLQQIGDLGSAGRAVDAVWTCWLCGIAVTGAGNLATPVWWPIQYTTTLQLLLHALQICFHFRWLIWKWEQLFEIALHPFIHLIWFYGSQDARCQQEDEDDEDADEEHQQHAAVLSDGSAAAQEAEHHDDRSDGDHQVDASNSVIGDHAYFVANSQVDGDGEDDAATEPEQKVEEE